jgi:CheY-like chemotaxis protein
MLAGYRQRGATGERFLLLTLPTGNTVAFSGIAQVGSSCLPGAADKGEASPMKNTNRVAAADDGLPDTTVTAENIRKSLVEPPLISILDDDRSIREALKSLIHSVGLTAETFESTEQFVQCGHLGEIACLILDVQLPGMSGLELQRLLSITTIKVPIVFITAYGDEEVRERALNAGAIEFLCKPFKEESLLKAVDSALKRL